MFYPFAKRVNCPSKKSSRLARGGGAIEPLEARQMLSAAVETVHYDSTILAALASSSDIQGYTPNQIRQAYGFDSASFTGSSTSADGTGQTIAIVDAFNDPNIVSDLKVFDAEFGLSAPPSFKILNQTGGTSLPSTDAGWAGEISLDVEWAHAIAPGANIDLVEATSDGISDLMAAVNTARNLAGVSVVSMSWGGSEFFSWGGGESQSQTNYDPIFTTPAGHQGVTFIAAAGDSGSQAGVQWPASSPNVLSVGGTSLTTDSSGNYVTESSWDGTSSGYSQIEVEPSYQSGVQSTGARSVADVSYDADPNTGFAVYDSLDDQGYVGWQEVGGTSAGVTQWAALIAIADQGRVLNGETTLDGPTQTLPMLYNLYDDSTTYADTFNDVVDSTDGFGGGGFGGWRFRWGGFGDNQDTATVGYDTITGLGTPKAGALIDALIGTSSSSSTGSGGSSGSSGSSGSTGSSPSPGSGTTVAALPASPLTGVFADAPIASAVEGTDGTLELILTNTNGAKFTGPVTVALYASTDNSLSSDDTLITTFDFSKLTIKAGDSKTVKLKFAFPTSLSNGNYYILGSITAVGTNTSAAEADALAPVALAAPDADLATSFTAGSTVTVNPGRRDSVAVTLSNVGNVTVTGTLDLNLYASATSTLETAAAQILATLSGRVFHIRAGHSITLHLHFTAPANEAAGAYYLIAANNSATNPADSNSANDVATATTVAAV